MRKPFGLYSIGRNGAKDVEVATDSTYRYEVEVDNYTRSQVTIATRHDKKNMTAEDLAEVKAQLDLLDHKGPWVGNC